MPAESVRRVVGLVDFVLRAQLVFLCKYYVCFGLLHVLQQRTPARAVDRLDEEREFSCGLGLYATSAMLHAVGVLARRFVICPAVIALVIVLTTGRDETAQTDRHGFPRDVADIIAGR